MTTLKLSSTEARLVRNRRARNKARNAVLYEVVDRIKLRLKKADPIEAAIVNSVVGDLRRMVRD